MNATPAKPPTQAMTTHAVPASAESAEGLAPTNMIDRPQNLIAEVAALTRLVTEYRRREAHYTRAISELVHTPSQSVASARYADGQWEVVMTTGHVWRRVEKLISTDTEHRYFEEWMPRPAVPGSRAALFEELENRLAALPVLSLMPRGVA